MTFRHLQITLIFWIKKEIKYNFNFINLKLKILFIVICSKETVTKI